MLVAAKATHILSAKNIRILYIESAKTVNEMTLNELVKLTTLWTTGPCSLDILYNGKFLLMTTSLGTNTVVVKRIHCTWIIVILVGALLKRMVINPLRTLALYDCVHNVLPEIQHLTRVCSFHWSRPDTLLLYMFQQRFFQFHQTESTDVPRAATLFMSHFLPFFILRLVYVCHKKGNGDKTIIYNIFFIIIIHFRQQPVSQ